MDPSSRRLLAIHRAVAHILHLSGAGDYINKFLSDMDDSYTLNDGSTRLDKMVAYRLKGFDNKEPSVD